MAPTKNAVSKNTDRRTRSFLVVMSVTLDGFRGGERVPAIPLPAPVHLPVGLVPALKQAPVA